MVQYLIVFSSILVLLVVSCSGAPMPATMNYPMGYAINTMGPVSPQIRPPGNRIFYDAIGNWIQQQSWLPLELNVPDTISNVASNVQQWTNGVIQRIPFVNRYPSYLRPGDQHWNDDDDSEVINHYMVMPPHFHHHHLHHGHGFHPWHLHHHFFRTADGSQMMAADQPPVDDRNKVEVDGNLKQVILTSFKKKKTKPSISDEYAGVNGFDVGNEIFVEPAFNEEIPIFYP